MDTKEILFKNLYDKNFSRIFRFVYYRVPTKEDTEDILVDVFSALWHSINKNTVDEENQEVSNAFLYAIARNKVADLLRKVYKMRFVNVGSDFFESGLILENSSPENLDKEDEYIDRRSYFRKMLSELLEGLSSKEQSLFELKYREGKSYSQIAKRMKISEGNAKVINNRLLKKLKKAWQKKQ